MELILDVNTQVYPINLNDKFRLMITTSVRDDGMPDEGEYDPQVKSSLNFQSSAPSCKGAAQYPLQLWHLHSICVDLALAYTY